VRRLIVSEGMALAVAGLGLGVVAGLVLSRALRSVLFEIPASDPATLAAVAALLAGVALVACAIPAGRAANLDPQAALRADG
jgi:ABC-type antimicrobial peptide transport system permease subunit